MQEITKEENTQLNPLLVKYYCTQNNEAMMLCCTKNCNGSSFICFNRQCQCFNTVHANCSDFIRASKIFTKLNQKRLILSPELSRSLQCVVNIYDNFIQQLSEDRQELTSWKEMYGFNKNESNLIRLLGEKRVGDVTGDLVQKIKHSYDKESESSNITEQRVLKFWQQRKLEVDIILNDLKQIYKVKRAPLQSLITQETDVLERFLGNPVLNFKLLFRASENNFSVAEFHRKCDGVKNTLLLVQTEQDRIIGGFTPIPWRSQIGYAADNTGKSFIFSLTLNQKYTLTDFNKAIYCREGYGPDFGEDICIRPDAKNNRDSYTKFPTHYNNGNYIKSQQATLAFCGSTQDHFMKIKEWEVFEVEWLSH